VTTRTLAAIVIAGALATNVAACEQGRKVHDTHSFPYAGAALKIDDHHVRLRVEPTEGTVIEVDRTLTGKATRNSMMRLDGGVLHLGVSCSGFVPGCGGTVAVRVPRSVALTIDSDGAVDGERISTALNLTLHNAPATMRDLSGPLTVSGAGGNLEITGCRSAQVTSRLTNGDLTLSFAGPPRTVNARTTGGSIRLELPAGRESYHVTVSASGGTARSSVPDDPASRRTITARADRGEVRASRH
jgi:Putative adhesin